jgi:hypothetical protein
MLKVPARIVENLSDAVMRVEAERDENTCRKDMTPSELQSLGKTLETLERPKAKERSDANLKQNASLDRANPRVGSDRKGETRHVIGNALGVSGTHYDRIKYVVKASEDETLPKEVREVAIEAKEEMDRTGKVHSAYERVRAAKKGEKPKAPNPRKLHYIDDQRVFDSIVERCWFIEVRGADLSLAGLTFTDEGVRQLSAAYKVIGRILRMLKEAKFNGITA